MNRTQPSHIKVLNRIFGAYMYLSLLTALPYLAGCGADKLGGPVPADLSTKQTPSDDIGQEREGKTRIVFTASLTGDGDDDIYTINSDGSDRLRLTETTASEREPAWSPDHSQIVYVATRDRGQVRNAEGLETPQRADVWIMEADGRGKRRLFAAEKDKGFRVAASPKFSPDGQDVICVVYKEDGKSVLMSLSPVTGVSKELAEQGGALSISSDGNKIAYAARPEGDARFYIYIFDKTDKEAKAVTKPRIVGNRPGNVRYDAHTNPAWTPNGTLLFSGTLWEAGATPSAQPRRETGIYALPNLESTEQVRITEERDYGTDFSPDGSRIVFTRFPMTPPAGERQGFGALYTSKPDGTDAQAIVTDLKVGAADW